MSGHSDNKLKKFLQSIIDDKSAFNGFVKNIMRNRIIVTLDRLGFYEKNK